MLKQKEQNNPDWLDALRETGAEVFEKTGLPTPAWEDWKYSNLRHFEREGFVYTNQQPDVDAADLPERLFEGNRIVFINGLYAPKLSDPVEGLDMVSLADYVESGRADLREELTDLGNLSENPMKALNTAHIDDGAVLILSEGTEIEAPLEILYFTTDKGLDVKPQVFARNLFILKGNSSMQVIENYAGNGVYAANHVCEIVLGRQASFKHYRLQAEALTAYHFTSTRLMQSENSNYETVTLTTGARFSRHDVESLLIAPKIQCILNGLYMLNGIQHSDTKILVDHMEPDGVSRQLYKGILDDQTRAVFQGKIHVRRPAQRTDGRQLNHALLLSDKAEIDAKPELEIYADDVQCAHGATAGALDEDPLFYMRSRGIPEAEARRLLMGSFLADVIRDVKDEQILAILQSRIDAWLIEQEA